MFILILDRAMHVVIQNQPQGIVQDMISNMSPYAIFPKCSPRSMAHKPDHLMNQPKTTAARATLPIPGPYACAPDLDVVEAAAATAEPDGPAEPVRADDPAEAKLIEPEPSFDEVTLPVDMELEVTVADELLSRSFCWPAVMVTGM